MMISNLPKDLVFEIFSRVPASSLRQLRLTCKRWYNLFKDPRFVHKATTQFILKNDLLVSSLSIGIHNIFDQPIELTSTLTSLMDSKHVKISEISHCEGFLLCTTKDNNSLVVVWNPSTGQTKWVQCSQRYTMPRMYCLGYDKSNNYKILSYGYYFNDKGFSCYRFELYDFNSDSWRVLEDVTRSSNYNLSRREVSLQGNIYWLVSNEEVHMVNFIQKFDFTTERFVDLSLPFESDSNYELVVLSVVIREEKLALLEITEGMEMKIWLTNKKIDESKDLSWIEFLVLDTNEIMKTGLTTELSFLVDEDNKMVLICDDDYDCITRIYIVGEDFHKQIYSQNRKGTEIDFPLLISYVPSLVQIQTKPKL